MSKLARRYHLAGGWKAVARANPQIKNPNVLKVGQRVNLP
ncbi:MAG: LysM peptidoglycan-binding domain-containing protein [Propionibacteriales bacterium]|nr:LysM peptidoglycan-binding domain-containing protein [Propionibacteriales bacterium]